MAERRRVNLKQILGDRDLRRELMVGTIQALQAREGIETSREQAERAYYAVVSKQWATPEQGPAFVLTDAPVTLR